MMWVAYSCSTPTVDNTAIKQRIRVLELVADLLRQQQQVARPTKSPDSCISSSSSSNRGLLMLRNVH